MIESSLNIDKRISEIIETWFIREPLMMLVLLSHEMALNKKIKGFRCGQGRIEYNPKSLDSLTKSQIEEQLKIEVIRILLNHPYRYHPNKQIAFLASNITLNEFYQFSDLFPNAGNYWADEDFFGQNFEFYIRKLKELPISESINIGDMPLENDTETGIETTHIEGMSLNGQDRPEGNISKASDDHSQDLDYSSQSVMPSFSLGQEETELWHEDDFLSEKIKEMIENASSDSSAWGSIPGNLQQILIANLKPQVDHRKILRSFRASIISSHTILTRFKPSRRYAWLYMGKKNDFTTHLLVAVDVSGSIADKDLQAFYSVINRFFNYGIKQISVIQFDTEIKGDPVIFKKAKKEINVLGRGGTNFQPVVDYYIKNHKLYDGLIIFTDGFAESPRISKRFHHKILFLYNNKENYEHCKRWVKDIAKVAWIE